MTAWNHLPLRPQLKHKQSTVKGTSFGAIKRRNPRFGGFSARPGVKLAAARGAEVVQVGSVPKYYGQKILLTH